MNIRFQYLIFITIAVLLNIYYLRIMNDSLKIYDNNFRLITENLNFFYDEIISNLLNNKGYYITKDHIKFYVRQLPVNTFLIYFLIKLFNYNVFLIYIFKNITTLSIYFLSIILLKKNYHKNSNLIFFFGIFAIFIPYNLHVIFALEFEDNLTSILLPVLFIQLLCDYKKKFLIISILLFTLYLTKQNMFLITIFLPFLILFLEKKKLKIISLVGPLIAIFLWGGYSYFTTNKFAFGSAHTSYAQKEINRVVLNDNFKNYYPKISVDKIPFERIPSNLVSEWDVYKYYKKKNLNYLKENPKIVFSNTLIKIKYIFFNRQVLDNNTSFFQNFIKKISNLLNTIFLDLGILIFTYKLFNTIKKKNNGIENFDIYYICIIVLNLTPHIIGWATAKHLVGLSIVSIIYFSINLIKLNSFKDI